MEVERFINSIFNSNSYLLTNGLSEQVWIVDPGDVSPLLSKIGSRDLKGILLTHSHFDHIYGLNELIKKFPKTVIYTSTYGAEGLRSDKLNGSRYTDTSFIVEEGEVQIVAEGNFIELWNNIKVEVWETAGHNRDCLTFYTAGYVFSGDALIPGIKVVAKSKYSDKLQVPVSIRKIISNSKPDDILCPGHNELCKIKDCKIIDLI